MVVPTMSNRGFERASDYSIIRAEHRLMQVSIRVALLRR